MEASDLGYGLIRSSVAVSLSEKITAGSDDSGSHLEFHTQDGPKPIRWLPDDAEPGAWSLPADVDEN